MLIHNSYFHKRNRYYDFGKYDANHDNGDDAIAMVSADVQIRTTRIPYIETVIGKITIKVLNKYIIIIQSFVPSTVVFLLTYLRTNKCFVSVRGM